MTEPENRRLHPRKPSGARALLIAPGLELGCVIVDDSEGGLRLRLDRALAVPPGALVVDIAAGLAHEVQPAWSRGLETGVRRLSRASLRGLVPQRLAAARAAWLRAGGR